MSTQMSLREMVEGTIACHPGASRALQETCRPGLGVLVEANLPEELKQVLNAGQIAEDVVESLPRALRGYEWQDEAAFEMWLSGTVKRHVFDELAKRNESFVKAFVEKNLRPRLRTMGEGSQIWNDTWNTGRCEYPGFDWQGETAFVGWLMLIAWHKIQDRTAYYTAQTRDIGRDIPLERPADPASDFPAFEIEDPQAGPSSKAKTRELPEILRKIIDEYLTDDERTVIELCYLAETPLSYREAEDRLGVSRETVRRRIKSGLSKLYDSLGSSFMSSK